MPWTNEPPLADPLYGLAAATCDAPSPGAGYRIYALGGYGPSFPVATAAAYDTSAKKWSPIAPMPTARAFLGATSGPGRLYALGGWDGALPLADAHEIYDPASDTWSPAAPLPTARMGLAAVTGRDGLIYALGGYSSSKHELATVEAYDPATDTWTPKEPMRTPRQGLAAVTGPDGLIYAIGGDPYPPGTVEVFHPTTNSWTTGPSLPAAISGLAAAVGPDGLIYAMGGWDTNPPPSGSVNTIVYSYNPATGGGWAQQAPLLTPRTDLAAATGPDGLIYAIGGSGGPPQPWLSTVEAFTVATPQTAPDPYIGNGTQNSSHIIFLDSNGTVVPLEPTNVTWQPSKQYRVQAIVYNDSTVAAPDTTVGFWLFINVSPGKPPDARLIEKLNVTVPPNGSVTVGPTMVGYQGLQGACIAVSIANPKSPYFNVDPTTPAEVLAASVERPPGSGHYGSAWRGYPDSCLPIEAQLAYIDRGDFNTAREYEEAVAGLRAELRACLEQWGGPFGVLGQ